MSPRSPEELQAEFEALAEAETDKLGDAAQRYAALKQLQSEIGTAVGEASRDLISALEEQGLTRVDAPGAKITLKKRRTWGIAEGKAPDDYLNNKEAARKWIEQWNPTQTDVGTTNIKRTWDVVLATEPDAALPEFLAEHEVPQLSVSRS